MTNQLSGQKQPDSPPLLVEAAGAGEWTVKWFADGPFFALYDGKGVLLSDDFHDSKSAQAIATARNTSVAALQGKLEEMRHSAELWEMAERNAVQEVAALQKQVEDLREQLQSETDRRVDLEAYIRDAAVAMFGQKYGSTGDEAAATPAMAKAFLQYCRATIAGLRKALKEIVHECMSDDAVDANTTVSRVNRLAVNALSSLPENKP